MTKNISYQTAMLIIALSIVVIAISSIIYIKKRDKKGVRYASIIVITIAAALATNMGLAGVDLKKLSQIEAQQEIINNVIKDNEKFTTIEAEFGDEVIVKHTDNIKPINEKDLERQETTVGKHKFTIKYLYEEEEIALDYELNIVDKIAPTLTGVKHIEIEEGEDLDLNTLDIKAIDNVDGNIEVKFDGEVDTNKPGEYEVKVSAKDKSGNEVSDKFTVTVKEKETKVVEVTPDNSNSGSTPSNKPAQSKPNTQQKPQPKPEAKPQPKPEAKPQPKPEAKPQPKPQPKPEAKPQVEYLDNLAHEMHNAVNAERRKAGLHELVWNDRIHRSARVRAKEITEVFSHTRPDGSDWWTIDEEVVYGENLAYGQRDVAAAMVSLMNSPGHKRNILSQNFVSAGYGVVRYDGRLYYAQLFGLD